MTPFLCPRCRRRVEIAAGVAAQCPYCGYAPERTGSAFGPAPATGPVPVRSGTPSPATAAAPSESGLATVALWLGIGALGASLVPLVGIGPAILAGLGAVIVGIVAWVKAPRGPGETARPKAVLGTIMGVLAPLVSWGVYSLFLAAFASGGPGVDGVSIDATSASATAGCEDPSAGCLVHRIEVTVTNDGVALRTLDRGDWSAKSADGGAYFVKRIIGPDAVQPDGTARLTLEFEIRDGARLSAVVLGQSSRVARDDVPLYVVPSSP